MRFEQNWTVSPGEILGEWCQENHLDVNAAARRFSVTAQELDDIIAARTPIDEDMAERLHVGTGVSVRMWLALELRFRDDLRKGKVHTSGGQ